MQQTIYGKNHGKDSKLIKLRSDQHRQLHEIKAGINE